MTVAFSLEGFVADARRAAAQDMPLQAAMRLMADTLADPVRIASAVPVPDQPETCLFEDATVSIWHECFRPDVELPPHDHALPAILGVYDGREHNRLWPVVDGHARPGGSLILGAGQFHAFSPSDVHSVHALDGRPSLGLHIYLGPLTSIRRSLYDWDSGAAIEMSGGSFDRLIRPVTP